MKKDTRKTIHYCWFGRSPLPDKAKQCIESWKRYMPDWEIKEWNENNFNVNLSKFSKDAYKSKKWAFVADYCRVKVLYDYGGLYLDTDMEILKPLDNFVRDELWLGYEDSEQCRPNAAIMGAGKPKNKYLGRLLDYYDQQGGFFEQDMFRYVIPDLLKHEVLGRYLKIRHKGVDIYDGKIFVYDEEYFYPIHYEGIRKNFTDNTAAVHQWAASWHDQASREQEENLRTENLRRGELLKSPDKVTVIVTIYNTETTYLQNCFESIQNQSFKNVEVILVDDGSGKKTSQFIDSWVSRHESLGWSVIHQKNTGSLYARKNGVEQSSGKYIVFVDSDDVLDEKMVEKLYLACITNKTEMAVCEFVEFIDTDNISKTQNENDLKITHTFDRSEIVKGSLRGGYQHLGMRAWNGPMWAKMYKQTLLEKVDWEWANYSYNEDEFVSIQTSVITNGLSFIQEQLYCYRRGLSTSKEGQAAQYNYYNGVQIPALRTFADLYVKFEEYLTANHIRYDNHELAKAYCGMMQEKFYYITKHGSLNKDNTAELKRQSKMFLPIIKNNSIMTTDTKAEMVLIYCYQDGAGIVRRKNEEIEHLQSIILSQNVELEQLRKPSIRLASHKLAGAVKRRLKR